MSARKSEQICVAFVLRASACKAEAVSMLGNWLQQNGFRHMRTGRASVTARIEAEGFQEIFHTEPKKVSAHPPGQKDYGAPGGWEALDSLPVPEDIADYVSAVSVEPPASRFAGTDVIEPDQED